jgi:hypothetical protein
MRRFSIRTLMAFVLVSAIGLAALRNANELWAGALLLVALAAAGAAVLGAIFLRGREQAWWAGFALFSGGYLVAAICPVQSPLATTQMLIYIHPVVTSSETGPPVYPIFWRQRAQALAKIERLKAEGRGPADAALDSAMKLLANLNTQLAGTPNQDEFIRVGHSLLSLLAGLVGGMVARWFCARRERAEARSVG